MPLIFFILFLLTTISDANAQNVAGAEYAKMGYNNKAENNPVALLEARLKSGEHALEYRGYRGYLDSLLEALEINPSSQLLVFSKTSLQHPLISSATPRALYFSDSVYIGWVQGSNIVEVMTTDSKLGTIFYVFDNTPTQEIVFERTSQNCLVCHDSAGTMGGGVPLLMTLSSVYSVTGAKLKDITPGAHFIREEVPIRDRWGGWYVTGLSGKQPHLGNIQLQSYTQLEQLDDFRLGNIMTLEGLGFFDTNPYLSPTSDIVALMVLEHQAGIQNQLTYIKFKAPAVLERLGYTDVVSSSPWDSLPSKAQNALKRMADALVQLLFMTNAVKFEDSISGSSIFSSGFLEQAIRDEQGRSLRDFDLENLLFKYPMSYLIYSKYFDSLPLYIRDYVYSELVEILKGRNKHAAYAELPQTKRQEIFDILKETKPDFSAYLAR